MAEALFGSLIGTVAGALIALAGTWMLVRDARRARAEELRNQAMAKMVNLVQRDALPDDAAWGERAAFAERFTLALLQIPDEARRRRMQDAVDLLAHGAHDDHYLQDFTRRSGYEVAHLARTDLRLCLAHRNEKSMPEPAPALREEVRYFRDYENFVERDIERQESGPPPE
ncbi:hypothetical protein ACIBKX_18225 [Streptomyces sp. NPDC050658]|uniref:hypothetical protein n=1 Tax=unclassified Streptomyces TaxID=2593676 RepID=UPI0034205B8A